MDVDTPSCSGSMPNTHPIPLQRVGDVLRNWQQGMERFLCKAQQAGAQLQLGAIENLQHFSDAVTHPSLEHGRRRRARPTMLCCLSGAAGGVTPGSSVRLPRSSELTNSLSLTKDSSDQGQTGTETGGPGTEEPILISEVANTRPPCAAFVSRFNLLSSASCTILYITHAVRICPLGWGSCSHSIAQQVL